MQPGVSGLRLAGLLVRLGRFGKRRLRDGRWLAEGIGVLLAASDTGEGHAGSWLRLARPLIGCRLRWLSLASPAQVASGLGVGFGLVLDV